MPPQYHPQHGHFPPQIRHHTPTASPPVPNGGPFPGHHPHHMPPRGHSPQPPMGRPDSRNDGRRMPSGMVPPPPPGTHPGITYMPAPPIYNGPASSQPMMHPHGAQYYPPQPQQSHQHPPPQQYPDDRRPPQLPPQQTQPGYAPQPPPPMSMPPRQDSHQPTAMPHPAHPSAPPPDNRQMDPQPPPPRDAAEINARHPPLLNTESAIKKLPQRRSHSIFTPVDENRSILGQHSKLFSTEESTIKEEPASRSHSVDGGAPTRTSPPPLPRSHSSMDKSRNVSLPDATFAPPSRTNSLTGGPLSGRPRGPKLTVQIPDGGSDHGGGSAVTGESSSPRNPADTPTHAQRRHGSIVLPPPSPSASAILSAGATGPPNPFARPPVNPHGLGGSNLNKNETPQSALPSRYLGGDFLPSPSSFYPEWNYKASDSNTAASPLNFSTPVVGSGPSFLTQDHNNNNNNNNNSAATATATSSASTVASSTTTTAGGAASDSLKTREAVKRKSEGSAPSSASSQGHNAEPKRVKVE